MQRFGQYQPSYGYGYQRMQPYDNIIRVSGLEGANAYQMPPNSRTALFDGNEDIVYIKTTDGAGFPTMIPYNLTRMENAGSDGDIVTRKDIEEINRKIDNLYEVITNGKQHIRKSAKESITCADDAADPAVCQHDQG